MTKLTQATAVAIATACSQVRGDWDHPGILAALRVEADKGTSAEDVFVAIANLCDNREARTPGLLNRPGSWWSKPAGKVNRRGDHNVPCVEHPQHDMPCDACKAAAEADPADPDALAALLAQTRAEIAAKVPVPRTPSRVPTPGPQTRLDDIRARIPEETP